MNISFINKQSLNSIIYTDDITSEWGEGGFERQVYNDTKDWDKNQTILIPVQFVAK